MKLVLKSWMGLLLTATFLPACSNAQKTINMETVKNVDLHKYLGTWYEIARFDHSFERGLVGVTATYTLRPDGKITVLNQGYKNSLDGKHSKATGKAKIPDPAEPGKFKVSFFLFFYAPYNILELDADYRWALIGSGGPDYLWILSRTPQMDTETYGMLINKAKEKGYDVSKLIKVEQPLK